MPIKVLQVVMIMNRGGAETMIMNYYRNIDRSKVQFDFLVHRSEAGDYEDEIKTLGGHIYRAFPIRPGKYKKYKDWLKAFFYDHKGEYNAVHAHIQENSGFVLTAAKEAGITIRASHSHTAPDGLDYKFPFRLYAKPYLENSVTKRFACGEKAGRWLYGNKAFQVLPNAVDLQYFRFNEDVRKAKRTELGIDKKTVIGNVARFNTAKNHAFIIDIFFEYHKSNPNSVLMLVGAGNTENEIRKKIHDLKLDDSVIMTGVRTDVNELLQAFDIFLFPSKLEGLPLSIVEAQAAGLPCVMSDIITKEVVVTDKVIYVSLSKNASEWADVILQIDTTKNRDTVSKIIASGYDIQINAQWLQGFYLGDNK